MGDGHCGLHTVHDIRYRFVWKTKYRYDVLIGAIKRRLRELLVQECEARGIAVIEGVIGKNHVDMVVACPTSLSPSRIAQYFKGRSSRLLQNEFPELGERYWGQHLWARGYFCATVGGVTDEAIREYLSQSYEPGDE